VEGIRVLPIARILRGPSNSCHHQSVYLLHADRVHCALELPLGVAPHLQGEDPTAEEGTDHPWRRQSPVFEIIDRIQQ
jgi:hypothetical protein